MTAVKDMFLNYSLWNRLHDSDKPIFLYGTGNGADKIISVLNDYHIKLSGIFASDGFVRDRYFHDFHVRSYSDVIGEYGNDIIILLAFGTTLPEVRSFIEQLDKLHDLYIPDVPLYGGELFDMPYFLRCRDELECALELLADKKSRDIFYDAVDFRLSGKLEYLLNTDRFNNTLIELFGNKKPRAVIDGGAFKGDSTEVFADIFSPEKIYAIEADPKTYLKLKCYAENETRCKIEPINAALWDYDGEIEYSSSGSRGAGEAGKNKRAKSSVIRCAKLDTIVGGNKIDFIKLDIEGAEEAAIIGGSEIIKKYQPDMAVSLYHRTDDLFRLIQIVHNLLPGKKLYLRRVDCIPMWDLTLYAVN